MTATATLVTRRECQAFTAGTSPWFIHQSAVLKEHLSSPTQDHSERKDKKQRRCLLDGKHGIEIATSCYSDSGEQNDDGEERM